LATSIDDLKGAPSLTYRVAPKSEPMPVAMERIWKWGHRSGAKRWKNFLVMPFHFLALKAQFVVLVSAFVMVSTVWSVSCLLFFYSWCPPCPAIGKSGGGGTCPPCPWSRRLWPLPNYQKDILNRIKTYKCD